MPSQSDYRAIMTSSTAARERREYWPTSEDVRSVKLDSLGKGLVRLFVDYPLPANNIDLRGGGGVVHMGQAIEYELLLIALPCEGDVPLEPLNAVRADEAVKGGEGVARAKQPAHNETDGRTGGDAARRTRGPWIAPRSCPSAELDDLELSLSSQHTRTRESLLQPKRRARPQHRRFQGAWVYRVQWHAPPPFVTRPGSQRSGIRLQEWVIFLSFCLPPPQTQGAAYPYSIPNPLAKMAWRERNKTRCQCSPRTAPDHGLSRRDLRRGNGVMVSLRIVRELLLSGSAVMLLLCDCALVLWCCYAVYIVRRMATATETRIPQRRNHQYDIKTDARATLHFANTDTGDRAEGSIEQDHQISTKFLTAVTKTRYKTPNPRFGEYARSDTFAPAADAPSPPAIILKYRALTLAAFQQRQAAQDFLGEDADKGEDGEADADNPCCTSPSYQ
ncbi:hypothetical protein V8E36_009966 [Tilletia maclaganii]